MSSSTDENGNFMIDDHNENVDDEKDKDKETCQVEKPEEVEDDSPMAPKSSQVEMSDDVGQFKMDFPVLVGCLKKELDEIIQNAEVEVESPPHSNEQNEVEDEIKNEESEAEAEEGVGDGDGDGDDEANFIENDILREIRAKESSISIGDQENYDKEVIFEVVKEAVKQFNQMKFPNMVSYVENDVLQFMNKEEEEKIDDVSEKSTYFTRQSQSKDMKITMSMSNEVKGHENEASSVKPLKKPSSDQDGNFNAEVYIAQVIGPELSAFLQIGTSDVVGFLDQNRNRQELENQQINSSPKDGFEKIVEKIDPDKSATNLLKSSESTEFIPSPMDTPDLYINLLENEKLNEEQFQNDAFDQVRLACGAQFDGFEVPKKTVISDDHDELVQDPVDEETGSICESGVFEVDQNSPFDEKNWEETTTGSFDEDEDVNMDDEKVDDFILSELEIAPTISHEKLEEQIIGEYFPTTPRLIHERILVSSSKVGSQKFEEPPEPIGSENKRFSKFKSDFEEADIEIDPARIEAAKNALEAAQKELQNFIWASINQQTDENGNLEEVEKSEGSGGESYEKSSGSQDGEDHEESEEQEDEESGADGGGGNEDSSEDGKDDENQNDDFTFEKEDNVNQSDEEDEDKSIKNEILLTNDDGPSGQLLNNNEAADLGSIQALDIKIESPPNEFIVQDIPSNQTSENSLVIPEVTEAPEKTMEKNSKSPSTIRFQEYYDDFGSRTNMSEFGSENYRVSSLNGSKSSQISVNKPGSKKMATVTQSDENLPEPEVFEIVENWLQNSEGMEPVPFIDAQQDDELGGEAADYEFERFKASKEKLEKFFHSLDKLDDVFKTGGQGQVDSVGDLDGVSLFSPGQGSNDSVVSSKKSIAMSKAKSKSLNPKELWNIDLNNLKDDLEGTKKSKFSWSKLIPCMKTPEDVGSPELAGQSVLDASVGGHQRGRREVKNGNEDEMKLGNEAGKKASKSLRKRSFSIGARLAKSRGRKPANN